MTTERYVRMAAGAFVLVSLALGYWVHPGWFFFTAFVGLNLFQSAFTGFCPLELILRRCGVPGGRGNLRLRGPRTVRRPGGRQRVLVVQHAIHEMLRLSRKP